MRKNQKVSSALDTRWGDTAITAPNEGAWNEGPALQRCRSESPAHKKSRARRFVTKFFSKNADAPSEPPASPSGKILKERDSAEAVPRHPLFVPPDGLFRPSYSPSSPPLNNNPHLSSLSIEERSSGGFHQDFAGILVDAETAADRNKDSLRRIQSVERQTAASPQLSFKSQSPLLSTNGRMRYASGHSIPTSDRTASYSDLSRSSKYSGVNSVGTPPVSPVPGKPSSHNSCSIKPNLKRDTSADGNNNYGHQELVPSYEDLWG